jgi:hypothetical protein
MAAVRRGRSADEREGDFELSEAGRGLFTAEEEKKLALVDSK